MDDDNLNDIEFLTTYISMYYLKKLLELKMIELKNRGQEKEETNNDK